MKPPLGTQSDQDAVWQGLRDGTIDIVETDHAPHTLEEKRSEKPPFGVPGLETALGLLLKGVEEKKLKLPMVKKLLYTNPKKIFHIPTQEKTAIEVDLTQSWTVGAHGYQSKCGWSPFEGWKLPGVITKMTYKGKEIVRPFYDPLRSYEDNYTFGPFGSFALQSSEKRTGQPSLNFLGSKIFMPFGIPAGPLLNSAFVAGAFNDLFDIAVYKTVRSRAYPCHPFPNVLAVHPRKNLSPDQETPLVADTTYAEPLSITNSFGVPSMSPDIWQDDMRKAVKSAGKGQVMIGSFQGTSDGSGNVQKYIDDFVLSARLVRETGAKILEANLSCPNEGSAHLLCFDIERTKRIAIAIKEEIGNIPLILKIAYFSDDGALEQFVDALGTVIDGLSAINTIGATVVDRSGNQALPGKGRERSGVCGSSIRWAGLDMVARLSELKREKEMKYAIIGVGGVMSAGDYDEYMRAGADAVLSATGAMWNPNLAREIWSLHHT